MKKKITLTDQKRLVFARLNALHDVRVIKTLTEQNRKQFTQITLNNSKQLIISRSTLSMVTFPLPRRRPFYEKEMQWKPNR